MHDLLSNVYSLYIVYQSLSIFNIYDFPIIYTDSNPSVRQVASAIVQNSAGLDKRFGLPRKRTSPTRHTHGI